MICEDSFYPIYKRINITMEHIKTILNYTFFETDINELLIETQKIIQIKLQNNIISLAEQQRKISRMDRQLRTALENMENQELYFQSFQPFQPFQSKQNNINLDRENLYYSNYSNLFFCILFGLIIGILYEKIIIK